MTWRKLDDFNFKNKTALIRVDVNVPVHNGIILDDLRLRRCLPTILDVLAAGGRVVLLSHFGRPNGFDLIYSTQQVVAQLSAILGVRVFYVSSCHGALVRQAIATLPSGCVLLLENTRFHPGEIKNDTQFAISLAALGDIFILDSFSSAHRAHASVVGIAKHLPSCAGRLLQQELEALSSLLSTPQRPMLAIIGGAKISTKLELLENLIGSIDKIIIGGGMANTFLAALGHPIGCSLFEPDLIDTARKILNNARAQNCYIILPCDLVIANKLALNVVYKTVSVDACPSNMMILDIGEKTRRLICAELEKCKTVVCNGPLGAFEIPPFNQATNIIANHIAQLTKAGKIKSIAGGGDTIAAFSHANAVKNFSYISTAGGAFLEWLKGETLPGVEILQKNRHQ